jgi:type I restriction enzyme M protein
MPVQEKLFNEDKMTNNNIEKRLWDIANNLRANSKLSSSEYSTPVLGLIFLRHAAFKFTKKQKELEKNVQGSRRQVGKLDFQAEGVLYLPEKARYSYLLNLPEGDDIGKAMDTAMDAIEDENPDLKGTLPRGYSKFSNDLLVTLLRAFSQIADDIEGDVFGRIYEYFLGEFAMTEGQKGGEFYTPISLVKLIVEVIEPFHGKILDPACGSGGMFVQSARFVEERKRNPSEELSIYGQERVTGTVNLCKMNLAVHGLSGDIREGNSYYEDIHKSTGKFDYVMANPPFNVKKVDYEKVKGDHRWPFGLPSTDNANYLWIQLFYSALNDKGRAGFVMANSAADARGAELEIRKKLIQSDAIDVMISISPNFFYTVTLPCTLWFLDKDKVNTKRKGNILFIDARSIFNQVDRAHREFVPEQIDQIAGIVRSYREEKGAKSYKDVQGLCKITTLKEIEEQGWSLNPGRYIGVSEKKEEDYDFNERIEEFDEELETLNEEAHQLEKQISENVNKLLGD